MSVEAFPQPEATPDRMDQPMFVALVDVLANFCDEMRRSTTLADVNIAAGVALMELGALLNLAGHGTEQSGELVNLTLKSFQPFG